MATKAQRDEWLRERLDNILPAFQEQADQTLKALEKNIQDTRESVFKEVQAVLDHYEKGLEEEGLVERPIQTISELKAVIVMMNGEKIDTGDLPKPLPYEIEAETQQGEGITKVVFHGRNTSVKFEKPTDDYTLSFWPDGPLAVIDDEISKGWHLYNTDTLVFADATYHWVGEKLVLPTEDDTNE